MKRTIKRLYKRFISPVIQLRPQNVSRYLRYFRQLRQYQSQGGLTHILWPILGEDTPTTGIDPHYFYQGIWAAQHIAVHKPEEHVDIGSQINLVGFLTAITKTVFVDLRPIEVTVDGLSVVRGSITALPFPEGSVLSLSCLHVAEHVGLGRYGDALDPDGTRVACTELARVLAPGGTLYFSLPIGRERTEFNAHRIHRPSTILEYFPDLTLVEFSAVTDKGTFIRNADIKGFDQARYACGLFKLRKNA